MQTDDLNHITSKLAEFGVLHKLAGARILVTGGTGFLGRYMEMPALNVTRIGSDGYHDALDGDWDYIIHMAPFPPDGMLATAHRCGARFMLVSSGAVYDYALTNLSEEKTQYEFAVRRSTVDSVIARVFTVAGYGAPRRRFALDTFIRQAMTGQDVTVYHGGQSVRSYLYGADLAIWLWVILAEGDNDYYDVGSWSAVTIGDVAHKIADRYDVGVWSVNANNCDPRPNYLPQLVNSLELGLREWVPFDMALDRTIREYDNEN